MDRITSNLPRIKNGLHGLQAFCILVAGIMTVVFFVKGKHSGGAIIFYLVLCFLSIPAIVYNSMTLWFARSRAWGNAYAFAVLDLLYTILWLAAMAAVAAFNSQTVPSAPADPAKPANPAAPAPAPAAEAPKDGEVTGKVETATRLMIRGLEKGIGMLIRREDTPGETAPTPEEPATQGKCDPACGVSKGMVGLAFFVFLFFALTTAISIQNALYYRAHGSMPLSNQRITGPQSIDPDRDAFSTAPHDLYAPLGGANDNDDDRDEEMGGGYGGGGGGFQSHRRASNDLYSGGAPMEGGRYGLPSYHADEHKDEGIDHLGRFDHEVRPTSGIGGRQSVMDGRGSSMGGRTSALGGAGGMPYGPDSYQDTSYGGATAYVAPRVDAELGSGGRVNFPSAPYGA